MAGPGTVSVVAGGLLHAADKGFHVADGVAEMFVAMWGAAGLGVRRDVDIAGAGDEISGEWGGHGIPPSVLTIIGRCPQGLAGRWNSAGRRRLRGRGAALRSDRP